MVKGCQGLGEGQQEAGVHSFKAPHNHYLCLACIAPVSVCMWGVLGLKGFTGSLAAILNFYSFNWGQSRVGMGKKDALTPECLILYVCTTELYGTLVLCSEKKKKGFPQFFLRYVTHLTAIH